jgi:hypothetical protein
MLIRRLAAGACALCLAVPAVAAAKDGYVGHVRHAVASHPAGDTKYDLPSSPPMHVTPVTAGAAAQATATSDDDVSGWQLVALGEAALVATLAAGGAVLVGGRRRNGALHPGA